MCHRRSHAAVLTNLSNRKQEVCSSGYATKNLNYTIKKKHSLELTAGFDGMLWDKQNVPLNRSYLVMGNR